MLVWYSKIREVFALVPSREGLERLDADDIRYEFGKLVLQFVNKERSDLCPFEKLFQNIESPDEVYEKLRKIVSVRYRRNVSVR